MLRTDRKLRKTRIRSKIAGTDTRPRVAVFRSNKFLYAQAINDEKGITVAHAKGSDAEKIAKDLAKDLKSAKVDSIVFDRAGYRYHGKVRKLAESLRAEKINF